MTEPLPRRIAWFAPWTWKRRWKIAAAALPVLMAYPLSCGPAMWFVAQGWMSWDLVEAVYTPFWLVMKLDTQLNDLLVWYLRFFVTIGDP